MAGIQGIVQGNQPTTFPCDPWIFRNYNITLSPSLLNSSSTNHSSVLENISGYYDIYNQPFIPPSIYLKNTIWFVNLVGIPIIFILGTAANLLCVLAFTCTRLNLQSTAVYLVFLAVVDTGYLLCLLTTWIGYLGVDIINREGSCQLTFFCRRVFSLLSVWTLVVFTAERYIVVYHPLRRHILCTPKRARLIVIGLSCISLLLNSYSFKIYGLTKVPFRDVSRCFILPKYLFVNRIIHITDAILNLVIPFIALLVFNCAIGIKVRKFVFTNSRKISSKGKSKCCETYKLKRALTQQMPNELGQQKRLSNTPLVISLRSSSGPSLEENISTFDQPIGYSKHQLPKHLKHDFHLRTTRALLVVSIAFLVLHLPMYLIHVYSTVRSLIDEYHRYPVNMALWTQFLQFLYYISFSTNCLIYGACNRSFRFALLRLFRGWFCSGAKLKRMKSALSNNVSSVKA